MPEYFRKTEAGRRELRERRLGLPRAGRNLLLIMDGTRPVQAWVAMIQGASLTDAAALLDLGLIEPGTGTSPGDSQFGDPTRPSAPPSAFAATMPAGWTQLGGLTQPGHLPSPGAVPRHQRALGRERTGVPPALTLPLPDSGLDSLPPTQPLDLPAETRRPSLARTAGEAGDTGPSTLPPADTAGFMPLDGGVSTLSYAELRDSITALVREALGLLKGYRYTLKIERARDLPELEAIAREFITEVRRVRGETMARMVRRALGFGG